MSNIYKPIRIVEDDYRNPWETTESGFWTVYKKDGSTSTRKVDATQANEELTAFHYAMAVSYNVMINTILELQDSGEPYSISDMALKTIDAIGKIVLKEKENVGN